VKIGLVLLIAENDEMGRAYSFAETRQIAQEAEADGYDSLWLYDHLIYRFGKRKPVTIGIWECWTFLAALAEATRRVELGTLVACNSFRNPALLVKMALTLDEVSQGRLILGLGAGWNQPEYDAFGFPFVHRVDRFEEALQIVRPLLKEGKVDFAGKYYQARNCEVRPYGPRPGGPPLMVGSFGKRMLQLTAQYADLWNSCYYGSVETFSRPRQKMLKACKAAGRDPATLGVTALLTVAYPDLMEDPPQNKQPRLTGSPEEIAQAFLAYAHSGVEHIMIHLLPYSSPALQRLAESVKIFRELPASGSG
jgi:alkanesulfonate monooxygenase SsuD/methylene tetrahydromethanopterin reductase-like flavin-dependent oxidoreductase (luciferase family)